MKAVVRCSLVLGLTLGAASVVSAQDPVELTIAGVSGQVYQWLTEYVEPTFEAAAAEAGTPVDVVVIDNGGISGEDQKQQYVLDLSVGEGADIMSFDGFWLPEFVDAGLLSPLSEVVGQDAVDWEGWTHTPEGLQSILGYQGELYGIPSGTDARVIWYNREVFEAAGLPTEWQPTSWEELLEAARTIKTALPDVVPLQLNAGNAMGEATTLQGYLMALLGAGHHIYDFEEGKWIVRSQAILDTLNLYDTIYNQEGLGNDRWQLVENGRDLSFEGFANGEVAMLIEGDYLWRAIVAPSVGTFPVENRDEIIGFAAMPAIEPGAGFNGQDFVTISGGTGFVLNPNTDTPQEAWDLLSFMFSVDSLEAFQAIQPRIRARIDVSVVGDDTMTAIAEEVLPFTTIRPQLANYNAISEQARLMTERIVADEMTPEEAMEAYAAAVTELVGEENVLDLLAE